jgi:hypothetical protein
MDRFDGTDNQGRKGIAYDWQSLYAAAQASTIDRDLSELVPQLVD